VVARLPAGIEAMPSSRIFCLATSHTPSRLPPRAPAATAAAQFGAPQRTARIGSYEVLVWNHNLLPAITAGFPRGCGAKWRR
jgi:hypothetical protein